MRETEERKKREKREKGASRMGLLELGHESSKSAGIMQN
jgi:hypothetical protein